MPTSIMVVEDDEELSEVLQYNLSRAGYQVIQAWDGQEAIDSMAQSAPDLVLLDIMLPKVDGWQVCRFLADSPDLKHIPIIIFTAKSTREDFDLARQFNLAGYFTKPYATVDVLRHVEKVLAGTPAAK